MKRLVLLILLIVLVGLACIYIVIPNTIHIQQTVRVSATKDGLTRKLFNENEWEHWWPGTIEKNGVEKKYVHGRSVFSIDKQTIGSIVLSAVSNKLACNTALNIVNTKIDTTQLIWTAAIPTSFNPVKRVRVYFASNDITTDINDVLQAMQTHFSKTENIYDFNIRYDGVIDSFLVTTSAVLKSYPSTGSIYVLVDHLKKYIQENGAKEVGSPMLNVSTNDSVFYLTRVAIPVDKIIRSVDNISFKRMPAGGNILAVDVKGGPYSVNRAFTQVQNFVADYHETAPAIPFFSLVTDRRQVTDTSKWVTRIYYPIM
ncbi:MAG: hypothetical protein ACXVBH_08360 [Flavisolibacter sp.]